MTAGGSDVRCQAAGRSSPPPYGIAVHGAVFT